MTNTPAPVSFIRSYVEWAAAQTAAPRVYHEAISLWILSSVLHRGVYIPVRFGDVRPNIWLLLLGASSTSKKSTAISMGKEILKAVDHTLFIGADWSPEGLIQELSSRNPCKAVLARDELGGLLVAMNKKAYMSDVKDLLMSLHDCPDIHERILRKDTFRVKDVYFTVVAATTPARLVDLATDVDVADGFLARFIACIPPDGAYVFKPVEFKTQKDRMAQSRLVGDLRLIQDAFKAQKQVEFVLDAPGADFYNQWLQRMEGMQSESPAIARLTVAALKIALLHHISNDLLPQIRTGGWMPKSVVSMTKTNIGYAIQFVEDGLQSTMDIFRVLAKSSDIEKVLDIVVSYGEPAPHSVALKKSKLTARRFKEAIETLFERRDIRVEKQGGTTLYVPTEKGRRWGVAHLIRENLGPNRKETD